MNTPQERFLSLVGRVLDSEATAAERESFRMLLREHPELIDAYREQTDMDTLVCWKFGKPSRAFGIAAPPSGCPRRNRAPVLWRRMWVRPAAAAAVLLLTGVGVWYGAKHPSRPPVPRPPPPVVNAPVTMVEWKGAWGLEMPQELPGRLRLAKGEAKVRLPSGVELVLLSPLELQVESAMEVRLTKGRLVAWVPPRASGFTVCAQGLTAWDIGTVFSVEADAEGSSLFVFKGSVQALDGSGGGVDICGAGEGVRAMAGRTPFKVAAEGEAGERLFKAVRGYAAISEPRKALNAARQIEELWMAKYVPEEASHARETARQQAAMRNAPGKIPFTKTAWVRPSVPAQQKEKSMKTTSAAALAAAAITLGARTAAPVSEPVLVNTSHSENRYWETVYTNEVDVAWRWENTNAVSVRLAISGMNGMAMVTNVTRGVSNILWRAFPRDAPTADDVYDLTLTFYGSGGAVVGAQTSRLAVVTGAFGETGVISTPEGTPWPAIKGNAVIPYDAGWAEATWGAVDSRLVIAKAGGVAQTNALAESAGYYGWKVRRSDWGYGTFNLALTFPGAEGGWDATLTRMPEGFVFSVR